MTVKEIKNQFKGEYVDVEVYRFTGLRKSVHTDFIEEADYKGYSEDESVSDTCWFLMDEEEYGNTILANAGIKSDFSGWYGDSNAKVLVIVLNRLYQSDDVQIEWGK